MRQLPTGDGLRHAARFGEEKRVTGWPARLVGACQLDEESFSGVHGDPLAGG